MVDRRLDKEIGQLLFRKIVRESNTAADVQYRPKEKERKGRFGEI